MNKLLTLLALASSTVLSPTLFLNPAMAANQSTAVAKIVSQAPELNPNVLTLALKGFMYAKEHGSAHKNILTVVDYTIPSAQKRMWVINLDNDKVLMNLRVAHGKNSGLNNATQFSNQAGSDESSLGVYSTGDAYSGKHGLSLRVNGLEAGLNSNAASRAVVIHPAAYVSPSFVSSHGRTGRSWGCFAVDPTQANQLIDLTKGGSVIFAYAPQENHDNNITHLQV